MSRVGDLKLERAVRFKVFAVQGAGVLCAFFDFPRPMYSGNFCKSYSHCSLKLRKLPYRTFRFFAGTISCAYAKILILGPVQQYSPYGALHHNLFLAPWL